LKSTLIRLSASELFSVLALTIPLDLLLKTLKALPPL
jgi:hypothetical protein